MGEFLGRRRRRRRQSEIENFKCSDFEFYNEIGSSGPYHSIRLVKSVSWLFLEKRISESQGDINELSHQLAQLIEVIQKSEDRWIELSDLEA